MMEVKQFKILIINAIKERPEVKSRIIKRIMKGTFQGYMSSDFVMNSQNANIAMKLLIQHKVIRFTPREPLSILSDKDKKKILANIKRRTFEALEYPKGSPERKRFNENALTSEYMPSYRYILIENISERPFTNYRTFRTKKEAEEYAR